MDDMNQTPPPVTDRPGAAQAFRTLAGSLMAAPVLLGVALFFALSGSEGAWDATPIAAAFAALGVVMHIVITRVIWTMIPAVEPGLDADTTWGKALAGMQPNMMLRFALAEAVVIMGAAAAFVVTSGGLTIFVVAAIASLVLMWLNVYPNESVIRRTQERLEAKGARTGLAEAFGFNAHP